MVVGVNFWAVAVAFWEIAVAAAGGTGPPPDPVLPPEATIAVAVWPACTTDVAWTWVAVAAADWMQSLLLFPFKGNTPKSTTAPNVEAIVISRRVEVVAFKFESS